MTDLPHLVMDLRMELPEPFKCPDACYMLSGFVDTLSIRELFPYCPDAEFVEQSSKAKIETIEPKLIGVNQEEHLIRFLIKNPNALNFEIQLHYSPINEDKWTQIMITQLLEDYLNPRLEFVPTRHTKRVAGKAKAATACARRLSRGGKRRRRANRTPLAVHRLLI
ncbi:hypothetical protein GPALN_013138 [Globodera pallida]|nr:hypothetical protein GPALN_013138 [Globodera pallida]